MEGISEIAGPVFKTVVAVEFQEEMEPEDTNYFRYKTLSINTYHFCLNSIVSLIRPKEIEILTTNLFLEHFESSL